MEFFDIMVNSSYSDLVAVVCIPLIISIFAFALPMLLGVIERIDGKYNSVILIKIFRKEGCCCFFLWSLGLALGAIILYVLKLPRLWDFGALNLVIDNSATILLFVFTILLIISTFLVVWLVYKYNIPLELLKRLIRKHDARKDKSLMLKGISQFMYYSINHADEDVARECLSFYFKEFMLFRKGREGQEITYPHEFYDVAFETNELLCLRDRRTISYYNDGTIYKWFFDEYQQTLISEKTYDLLWRCLVRNVEFEKDDFVSAYWRKAHQYLNLILTPITPEYGDSFTNIINEEDVKNREMQRNRFLEFHYALGGVLLYKRRYSLIRELISYSNSTPPKYVLVPDTLNEVVQWFMRFSKEDYLDPIYYEKKYPFPEVSGVNGSNIIRKWIQDYTAILLLNLYTMVPHYIYSNPLQSPTIPAGLEEQTHWKRHIGDLKENVERIRHDNDMMKSLDLSYLVDDEWFEKNGKDTPTEILDNYLTEIETKSQDIKETQEIDEEKERAFKQKTQEIVTRAFDEYRNIWSVKEITNSYGKISLFGQFQVMEKMAFARQQDIGYGNSSDIVASLVAKEFLVNSLLPFAFMKRKRYLLNDESVFDAVNRLHLDKDEFVIISMGLHLPYYRDFIKVNGLVENSIDKENSVWCYQDIKIVNTEYIHPGLGQSLIILKSDDLPYLIHKEIGIPYKNKYKLVEIDSSSHVYASIINLNENEDLRKELVDMLHESYLNDKVLVCVDHHTEIRYKLSAECIQLKIYNQFQDRGAVSMIEDIKNIWRK